VKRFPYSNLLAAAELRPPGYLDDVLSAGRRDGEFVELSDAEFHRLRDKYRAPVHAAGWPKVFQLIAHLKTDADAGVGDTIARVLGPVGGDAFKAWFKRLTGKSCGCTERQDELNRNYPYPLTIQP